MASDPPVRPAGTGKPGPPRRGARLPARRSPSSTACCDAKGATSNACVIVLTRNEVDLHKVDYPANALGVVRNIKFHVHKDAPPPLWGLSASLTAIALLPACGTNGLTSGKTSTHAF